MKIIITALITACSLAAPADWYYVTAVTDYNKITAHLADPAADQKDMVIRIANLENIEDIQNDRTKVLFTGAEPKQLAQEVLEHQVVWIDRLEVDNGENVANVYPSYNQVLRTFTDRRIGGTYSISPEVMQKIKRISTRMLSSLATETPDRNPNQKVRSSFLRDGIQPKDVIQSAVGNKTYDLGWYENEYSKALFIYDALNWFKQQGQYLPQRVQEIYIGWLDNYLIASGVDALTIEIKVQDMQQRSELYRDFYFDE